MESNIPLIFFPTNENAALEVTRRLWKLSRSWVRQSAIKMDGTKAWVRIGPFGLLDIPAALTMKDGQSLERARLSLNPILYQGAHRKSKNQFFALLADEALALDGKSLRLATVSAIAMRYARDEGGVVNLSARSLWEYLNARGSWWPRA